nr:non-ribosomal peptide synthetase [Burkholderia pseudomallei]
MASQHVHHLAYVIYTSGSTGRPKGVMVEHAQVVRLFGATQAWFGFDERDVWTLFHSYGFDFSVWEMWGALLHGGRLVIVPTEVTRTPSAFFALLCAEGVTVLNQTPSAFQALMSAQEEREEAAGNIERANVVAHRLRYVIFGGEALEPRTLASWYARHGERTQLVNMYGITETTVHVTYYALRAEDAMRLGASPIGVRIPDLQLYVLDARREPVPMGVTGELYVGGAGVARGYLNRPELTRERFIDDPFVAGGRLYKTGDLARWRTDGSLEYLGRNDFQVKIRGFRIELGEIEAQLAKVAGVREVVVLARDSAAEVRDSATEHATPNALSPSPETSTATAAATATATATATEKRLVAYYTGDADVAALRAQAAQHLPSYMVPSAYVRLDAWPLTPNGKLDRRALPAPADDAYARAEYEAPQGAKEEALAAIWRELLHVERVSRHDNFFELGGHSLLAIGVIERMRREGLHTDVRSIFNAQTLSDLAARAQTDDRSIQAPPNLIPARATRITPDMLPLVALTQTQIDMLAVQVEGGAANIQDIYPLAPLQEGMVFHHLLHAESDAYMEAYFVGFRTRARLDRFLDALRMIVDRHDILRTGFFWEGLEQPVQIVQRRVRLPIEFVDLDPADGDVLRQLEARHDPRAHRLDIRRPALLSCHAAHDPAAGRWLLCVMAHHLAIDNTSLKLLVAEEQAIEQGGFDALPPAPSFRNFIAQIASGVDRREHEAFFSAMLGDIDSPTHPFGLQDVQGDGREIAEFQQRLSPELSKAIRVCTRRLGVSPASLMHLAWAMVLSRATGRREAVFGTVLFGRMQGGERGMGMFINTLPIRIDVDERYVAECLAHTHERVVQLIYHEHAPLALALRCSGLPARQALFSSLLNYRHSEQAARPPRDDDDIQYLDGNERTNYPLTVSIDDLGEAFSVTVQARHPASPERIRAFMETALEQLVRALDGTSGVAAPGVVMPRIAVCDIDVLPSEERHRLLVEWNDTAADYPQDQCLHRLFEAQAARHPDTIALIADGEPVGYAELNRRANRLARHLSARGLQPDQRVAICIDRGIDMVVAMLAVLKAGGAYVPLDPAYPSERLDYLLRDCAPVALLTHARLGASMQTRLVLALARLDTGCALIDLESDAGAWRHERDDDPPPSGLTPRHLAYVIYTSGSTGQPKGVMVEHRSVCNLVAWHAGAFDVGTGCRSASVAGVAFDATTWEVWAALCNGGCLSLAPGDAASDPQALLRWWRAQELDVGFLVTPLAELAYATGQSNAGMRTLLIGGDRLSRWPDSMPPGQMLVNNYGPTEATVVATSGRLQPGEATPPIGRPIANTRVYVLDAWLRPAPIGVAGELYIGGVQVARGYLNRPELTRERFIDDPFVAGGRLYRTGDLARWRTDGSLEYLGRNDFQVKIRGFRIELGEIEAQLAKVADVREVVVLARDSAAEVHDSATEHATPNAPSPSPETTTATAAATATATAIEKRLVAYYTGDADVVALRAQAAQHLPSYMVPSAYVRLDAWPLTPNGKLDRRALPAPADDAYARAEYEAPQGAKEEALAAIWRELLHVERVSRHDNFFELGGHSLLAVQLVSRLRQALSVEVALGTVFDAPVLSALAERLEAENTAVLPPIPLTPRDGRIALSLAQQRLWFLTQLEGVSEAYHMSGAVRLDGPLNREVLQRALNRIVMRHEALRTCFAREEGEPIQVIQPHADLTVSYHDLREAESIRHEAGNLEQRAKDLSQAHASAPFDLSRDLPVRVLLLQLADEAHVVQVVMHHIASDGWSVGVFLQELSALYGSFIAEQGDPLAPLPLQYADYAAWQRRWLASGQLEKQGAFWQTNLSGAPTLLELPTDRPRPPKQSHAGASVEVKLGAALSERVKRLSQRHGVTPYMTLLSSWAAVLSRLSGRDGRIALSLAQQRLWFLTQLEGVSEAYHMSGAVRLDGPLNREVLQRALNRIVMRHEALRTCFAREEGEPIQVIQPHADLTVSYHDLREAESIRHEAGNLEQRAKDLSQAHASAPFDLSRDLPVRVLLLQLADEAHVVQVVMHHIASDGWSVGVFLQELSALYGSFIAEQGDPLAPLPLQYADYAAWQRRWLASGQLEKQGAFWQTNLSGAPTLLELPTDRPRPPKQSHAGASVEVKLGAALSERVKRLSQRHGVTPYMTLLSSWAAVLSRLSGQEEVVIGSPVAGRNRTEVEALIGFFVNTLALRLDLSSEPTVGELLKRTKAQVLSAQAHQDLPFDQVVERVKPPRSTAHPPLFQVMFDWHNTPARALTMPGLTVSVASTETTTSQYDLVLSMQERNGDIVGHLNYATALFDEQTARRYARYWRRLLEGMTAGSANVSVARLPLLDEAEREQVVHEWNATERAYPIRQCIHQLFEAQAARTPNAIAIAIGDERVTYAALNASANRLARHLRALGVVADTRVAVCIERGAPMVIALLAIWKAGGAYVPLDPAYPRERIAYMLRDSAPIAVLTSRASRDLVASHLPDRAPLVVIDAAACPWDALSGDDLDPNDIELNATHLCYVIYTSGSTGQPKGVMIEHRNLVNYTLDAIRWFGLGPGETVLQQNSLNFDLSLEEIVPALSSGATLAPAVELFGAGGSARGHSARPTMIHLTAAHWQQLVGEWHRAGARPAAALEGVRLVNVTGDALSPHKLEQWDAIRPAHTRLINTYGPTEITISCSAAYVRHAPGMSRVSIGRPFANSRMYLLDARGEPVPVGVTGELYIGGDGVARGYLNRPELSAERFVDDPFRPGSRMYKTGDLACRRGDGEIEFVGRNDFQVKVRGFRVELSEVETRLAAVDGVQEIAVLAREDAPGEKRLVAYYTGAAEMAALRECAARDLPAYMMPAAYVCLPALPLTPNGKLDRNALPPPAHDADSNRGYEAPQGDIEETLARIWEQLLERERVGRHDNFFDLGGHSLLTVSLIERMRQADLHADVAALFTTSTLAELAACTTKLKEILL